jgi:tRNA(Ile)-lysidine synthase
LPPALARLIVIRLAERAAGRFVPAAGAHVDELLALAPQGGSAALDVGGGVRAVVEYGLLRLTAAEAPVPAAVELAVPGRARFGDWELECELAGVAGGATRAASGAEGADGLLDADAVGGTLTIRSWRAGDRIAPLGLAGTKTLADLFTDRRVPRAQRPLVPVVVAGEAIAWVPGLATSRRFGVTDGTVRAARLRARRRPRGQRALA